MEREYSIVLASEPEEGGFSVFVPTLAGCVTHGLTVEKAIENAKEAIAVYIESLEAHGEPVPTEAAQPPVILVRVAA